MSKHRVVEPRDSAHRARRFGVAGAAVALGVGVFFVAAPPAFAVSTTVTTATALKAALADGTNDVVVLGADITISDGSHPDVSQTKAKTLDLHGQTLTVNSVTAALAGIRVAGSASLTVEDTVGLGTLDVTGGDNGAGLGGNQTENAASISVISGSVTAHGGVNAAGIGGGGNNGSTPGGSGGTQSYSGGSTSATAGANAAGLGGGNAGNGGTVTVSGSASISANGNSGGAGIGGGEGGNGVSTVVSGGNVTAQGGGDAAGVGGGSGGSGGSVSASGGVLSATGGPNGAGVGGGLNGAGGTISVSGVQNPQTAPTILVAQGGASGAGIGGGSNGAGGSLSITGSAVQATGGSGGAGVGGGDSADGGTVNVSAGALVATGGTNAAGIGGGNGGNGGSLTTSSTVVGPDTFAGAVSATDGGGSSSAVGTGDGASSFGTLNNGGGLTIPSGATLRIPSGASATNSGSILDKGTITGATAAGTLVNSGVIFLSGGTIQGDGDGVAAGDVTVSVHNYKLLFDSNGGPDPNPSAIHVYASTALASGATFPTVSPPTGGFFLGWYTAASGGTQVTTSTDLSALLAPGPTTTTLFAHYRVPQTITFPIIGDQTFGAPDFNVSATASSGLPVTFSAGPPAVCTVSGSTIHIVAAGACTVNANQAGNANFLPAPQVQRTFQVRVGVLTVTASGSQTFGGSPSFTPSVSLPAGVSLSGTLSCTYLTGNVLIKPSLAPGSYTIDPLTCGGIVVTGPNASSYHLVLGGGTFVVSQADLQVKPTGKQVYQGAASFTQVSTPPPNVTVSGTLSCTQTAPDATPIDANLAVGSYTIDGSSCSGLSLTGTQAFGYHIQYINGPYTVTPKPITVTATGAAAYGGAPTFTPQASLPSGLTLSGALTCTKLTGNIPISATLSVRSYTIDATTCSGLSLTGTGSGNYQIVYANGPFVVSKATLAITTHTNSTADANHLHKYIFTTSVINTASNGPVVGIKVTITVAFNGTFRASCSALTNASGVATCSSTYFLLFLSPGHAYTATTAATVNYNAGLGNGKLGS